MGDIESLPFLEAIRQMGIQEAKQRLLHPPDLAALHPPAGELKTKPTQHSVKELREIGIQPDILLCRADRDIPEGEKKQDRAVHQRATGSGDRGARRRFASSNIWSLLHDEMLDEIVCHKLGILAKAADLSARKKIIMPASIPNMRSNVALVGNTSISPSPTSHSAKH